MYLQQILTRLGTDELLSRVLFSKRHLLQTPYPVSIYNKLITIFGFWSGRHLPILRISVHPHENCDQKFIGVKMTSANFLKIAKAINSLIRTKICKYLKKNAFLANISKTIANIKKKKNY